MHNTFDNACKNIESVVDKCVTSSNETVLKIELREKNEEIKRLKEKEEIKQDYIQKATRQMNAKFQAALSKLHKLADDI